MTWCTLDELKLDLRSRGESGSEFDDEQLQQALNAAMQFVQRVRPEFAYSTYPQIGDAFPLAVEVTNPDGVPVNPVTIALRVDLPDGTFVAPTVINPPPVTGLFEVNFVSSQAGVHTARWSATGPDVVYSSTFTVRDLTGLPAPTDDLRLGTIRLAGRWHNRRRSPDMIIQSGDDFGGARVPGVDPDIDRLLGIGRFRGPVFA